MLELFDIGGRVLWEGPSRLDGEPIVAIATGLKGNSTNSKTDNMVQTWILRQDVKPGEAARSGADESVCGDCVHRPVGGLGTCYVNVGWGVNQVWKSWRQGKYQRATTDVRAWMRETFHIRLGAYGDPVAVPSSVWHSILPTKLLDSTGYTHQWRNKKAVGYKGFLMASVESEAERVEAKAKGWRSFMVVPLNRDIPTDMVWCPSDALNPRKKKIPCKDCGLCNGARYDAKDVGIFVHGPSAPTFGHRRKRNPAVRSVRKAGLDYDPLVRVAPELHAELKAHVKGRANMKAWVGDAICEKIKREQTASSTVDNTREQQIRAKVARKAKGDDR